MESNTPPDALTETPRLLQMPIMGATRSALADAAAEGMYYDNMLDIARVLTPKEFCQSMSVGEGEPVRQEIYRVQTTIGPIHIKLALAEELMIVEFRKE